MHLNWILQPQHMVCCWVLLRCHVVCGHIITWIVGSCCLGWLFNHWIDGRMKAWMGSSNWVNCWSIAPAWRILTCHCIVVLLVPSPFLQLDNPTEMGHDTTINRMKNTWRDMCVSWEWRWWLCWRMEGPQPQVWTKHKKPWKDTICFSDDCSKPLPQFTMAAVMKSRRTTLTNGKSTNAPSFELQKVVGTREEKYEDNNGDGHRGCNNLPRDS